MKIHFGLTKKFSPSGNTYKLVEEFCTGGELVKLGRMTTADLLRYSDEWFKKFYHKNVIYYIFSKRTDDWDTPDGKFRRPVKITHHKRGGYTITCKQIIPLFDDIYII